MRLWTWSNLAKSISINMQFNFNFKIESTLYFYNTFFYIDENWIIWNWFLAKIILISQIICFNIIQNDGILNRGLSSNIWWPRSANDIIFTEQCTVHTKKHILLKKLFTNGVNIGLPLQVWVKKQSMECKHTNSLVKKKFWAQWSVKKMMQTVFREMNWFFRKMCNCKQYFL